MKEKSNKRKVLCYKNIAVILLVLIMSKISGYVKTLKVKDRGKDKNNKLMTFSIDDEKLLEKYKAIWTKIEEFKKY